MRSLNPSSQLVAPWPHSLRGALSTGAPRPAGPIAPCQGALAGRASRPRCDRLAASPVGRAPVRPRRFALSPGPCGPLQATIACFHFWLPTGYSQTRPFLTFCPSLVAFTRRHYMSMAAINAEIRGQLRCGLHRQGEPGSQTGCRSTRIIVRPRAFSGHRGRPWPRLVALGRARSRSADIVVALGRDLQT